MDDNKIRNLIIKILDREEEIDNIVDLDLDSIEFINIVVELEKEFHIKFNEFDMKMENFTSICSFTDYVHRCMENSRQNKVTSLK